MTISPSLARVAALIIACVPAVAQNTWYVDDDGTPPGSGTLSDPYTSIQYAIEQGITQSGDTLIVLPGVYAETLYFPKSLTVSCPAGSSATRLAPKDVGQAACVTAAWMEVSFNGMTFDGAEVDDLFYMPMLHSTGGALTLDDCAVINYAKTSWNYAATIVQCTDAVVTVTGSRFVDLDWQSFNVSGGSAHFSECEFTGNYGGAVIGGGAVGFHNCPAWLEHCEFTGNGTDGFGGAVYAGGQQPLTINGCSFADNWAFEGSDGRPGGAVCGGSVLVTDSLFSANASGGGGAIWANDLSVVSSAFINNGLGGQWVFHGGGAIRAITASVSHSSFVGNSALVAMSGASGRGGAIAIDYGLVESCKFENNSAYHGGAVYSDGGLTIQSSHFVANHGFETGGVVEGTSLERCTLVLNGGPTESAVLHDALATDSVIWGNFSPSASGSTTLTYSNIEGGWPGEGNIDAEPLFVSAPGDLHLRHGSPCIDAGDPASDLDDDGTRADMGAFPYTWTDIGAKYCSTNVNSSGLPASVRALGSLAVADNWLRLSAIDVAKNQFGYYLMSTSQAYVPFFGGNSGVLCLGSPIVRFNIPPAGKVLFSGESGVMEFRPDLTNLPQGIVFQPGESWNFQVWFRDVVGGTFTSNTSDGVTVTWE